MTLFEPMVSSQEEITSCVECIDKNTSCLIVLGTGGSSLGAQALYASLSHPQKPIIFVQRDTHLEKLPQDAFVMCISKNGMSTEINAAFNWFIKNKFKALLITNVNSGIAILAKDNQARIIEHPNTGGRFSCLTIVGMVPYVWAGGSKSYISQDLHNAYDGALWHYTHNADLNVIMIFDPALLAFCRWYAQLFAETVCKNKKGAMPYIILCPEDQHSIFQAILDGKTTVCITIIRTNDDSSPTILAHMKNMEEFLNIVNIPYRIFAYSNNIHLADISYKEQTIGIEACKRDCVSYAHNDSNTEVTTQASTELEICKIYNMQNLMYYFMQEACALADLLENDPFSQPAVESLKKFAFDKTL